MFECVGCNMLSTTEITNISEIKSALQSLRQKHRNKQIVTSEVLLKAAELYLTLQRPKRAEALLKKINIKSLTSEQLIQCELLKENIKNSPPSPYNSCSLNMIVKNEEQSIADALDSVDLIMDEIAICDTGSTDQTLTLVE